MQDAPGFFGAEGAVHVVGVEQPQRQVGARQRAGHQLCVADQGAQRPLQVERWRQVP